MKINPLLLSKSKCALRPRSTLWLSRAIRSVATGNLWSGPMKSSQDQFHWSAPLVCHSNWSDRTTESKCGSALFGWKGRRNGGGVCLSLTRDISRCLIWRIFCFFALCLFYFFTPCETVYTCDIFLQSNAVCFALSWSAFSYFVFTMSSCILSSPTPLPPYFHLFILRWPWMVYRTLNPRSN